MDRQRLQFAILSLFSLAGLVGIVLWGRTATFSVFDGAVVLILLPALVCLSVLGYFLTGGYARSFCLGTFAASSFACAAFVLAWWMAYSAFPRYSHPLEDWLMPASHDELRRLVQSLWGLMLPVGFMCVIIRWLRVRGGRLAEKDNYAPAVCLAGTISLVACVAMLAALATVERSKAQNPEESFKELMVHVADRLKEPLPAATEAENFWINDDAIDEMLRADRFNEAKRRQMWATLKGRYDNAMWFAPGSEHDLQSNRSLAVPHNATVEFSLQMQYADTVRHGEAQAHYRWTKDYGWSLYRLAWDGATIDIAWDTALVRALRGTGADAN